MIIPETPIVCPGRPAASLTIRRAGSIHVVILTVFMAACASGAASEPLPKPIGLRGTQAAITGPNLMADSSFESLEPKVFRLDAPFQMTRDPHAHSGKAVVRATLSHSGKRVYSHMSVWKNTEYLSSVWV